MTDSQPPSDQSAEECVIGSILMSTNAMNTVASMLTPGDFYRPNNATIYAAALHLLSAGEPVDAMTVAQELGKQGDLQKVGGAPFLLTCVENTPSAVNVSSYARIVAEKAKLRRLGDLGNRLKQLAYTDASSSDEVNSLLAEGEELFRAEHEPEGSAADFGQLMASWEDWQTREESAIRTPWPSLNRKLNGGLQRGRLYTIAARPGVGKSVAALQLATYAAHWGFPSAMFSLEMSKEEVTSRAVAAGATVDFGRIMRKDIDLPTRQKIDVYQRENHDLPIQVIDKASITVEQIIAHSRTIPKLGVVVVDYLQLMQASDRRVSREQQVAHFSRSLKIAAKELNVAMIACSQLNRGPVKDGKPRAPTIADLRESGAIEQDSDSVILLHNDEDDPGIIQMIVGKNRNGTMGDLALNFEGHYQRITEA